MLYSRGLMLLLDQLISQLSLLLIQLSAVDCAPDLNESLFELADEELLDLLRGRRLMLSAKLPQWANLLYFTNICQVSHKLVAVEELIGCPLAVLSVHVLKYISYLLQVVL